MKFAKAPQNLRNVFDMRPLQADRLVATLSCQRSCDLSRPVPAWLILEKHDIRRKNDMKIHQISLPRGMDMIPSRLKPLPQSFCLSISCWSHTAHLQPVGGFVAGAVPNSVPMRPSLCLMQVLSPPSVLIASLNPCASVSHSILVLCRMKLDIQRPCVQLLVEFGRTACTCQTRLLADRGEMLRCWEAPTDSKYLNTGGYIGPAKALSVHQTPGHLVTRHHQCIILLCYLWSGLTGWQLRILRYFTLEALSDMISAVLHLKRVEPWSIHYIDCDSVSPLGKNHQKNHSWSLIIHVRHLQSVEALPQESTKRKDRCQISAHLDLNPKEETCREPQLLD